MMVNGSVPGVLAALILLHAAQGEELAMTNGKTAKGTPVVHMWDCPARTRKSRARDSRF
jgi:hypothetical protein